MFAGRFQNNHGLLNLEVLSASLKDAGRYTVKAFNSVGEAECSATVSVEASRKSPSPKRREITRRPMFTFMPMDLTKKEGEDATFTCKIDGNPQPNIKWQRDLRDISDGNRYNISVDSEGNIELTIRKVTSGDEGLYYCLAQSSAGRTKCSASLRVIYRAGRSSLETARRVPAGDPPKFKIKLPKIVELEEGDRLRLEARADGKPEPNVTWHRGTFDLSHDMRFRISTYQSKDVLELRDTMVGDSGEYIARATNVHGVVETKCVVKVKRRSPRRDDDDLAAMQAAGAAPFFMKPLPPSIDVMEGFNVQMDCIIEGGVELIQYKSSNIRHMQREFASRGFEGRYKRMGAEDLPPTQAAGRLPREPRMAAPEFATRPADVEVEVGGTAEFSCEITGTPTPEVIWLNGRPVTSGDRTSLSSDGSQYRLVIRNVNQSDTGNYICTASSDAGMKSSQAALTLKGTESETPKFDIELKPETEVKPGDTMRLTCRPSGQVKSAQWSKDGQKNNDYGIVKENGHSSVDSVPRS
ncbi:TITIN-like protein [Mya arenaria]|uniref:TITIN-like protein n=1 Tax=Mya arenaria TaxID=6604 RepID=A0ABY7EPV2_MYAAR|nr:TITIN-like protein [Mya arenaria]